MSNANTHASEAGSLSNFVNNVYDLRQDSKLCDVQLLVDGKVFRCNRIVLAARSLFFHALFTNGMKETGSASVNIADVRSDTFELFLRYAYTGECQITRQNAKDLIVVADRFNTPDLVNVCCSFLVDTLTPCNAIELWRFAKYHFFSELQDRAFNFILRHFETIALEWLPSPSSTYHHFVDLTIDELIEIIEPDDLNAKNEYAVFMAVCKWIDFDEENRRTCIFQILCRIRTGTMSRENFVRKIENHDFVKHDRSCTAIVLQTLLFFDGRPPVGPNCVISRSRSPNKFFLVLGGFGTRTLDVIECYNPRAKIWRTLEQKVPMPTSYAGVAVLGTRVYMVGGFGKLNRSQDFDDEMSRVMNFDLSCATWSESASLHTPRCFPAATVLDGYIYVAGGHSGRLQNGRLKTVERYDPRSDRWTMMPSMINPRSDSSICVLDGRLVIAGGFDGWNVLKTCEMFDPKRNRWESLPALNFPRSGCGLVAFEDTVYAVGGCCADLVGRHKTVEKWSPGSQTWTVCTGMMRTGRSNMGIGVLDNILFVIGGFNGSGVLREVECYDFKNGRWFPSRKMNVCRSACGVAICDLDNVPSRHRRDFLHV